MPDTDEEKEAITPPSRPVDRPIDPYEDARLSGLCEEGAEEVARQRHK